jgi:prolipoprotein diacylglyceryl transferase
VAGPGALAGHALASLPSPSKGTLEIGPLTLRAYGLAIALGVIAAVAVGGRRWVARGGDPNTFPNMALWVVPLGVIGARLYHVATDYDRYEDDLVRILQIWKGGLSIWGALAGGVLGFLLYSRRHHLPLPTLLDCVAPGLATAQAIGRLGNWFNQELFGKPTDLPWGLEIAPEHRPAGYIQYETFHPAFLYEALWNVGVVGALLWAERRFRLRHGQVFLLYGALYCVGRFWIELLRIDPAREVLGLRVNVWTTIVVFAACVAALAWNRRRHAGDPADGFDADDHTDAADRAAVDDRAGVGDVDPATNPAPAGSPSTPPSG